MREAIAGGWGTLAAMIRAHAFRDGIPLEDDLLLGDAERLLEDEHVFVWIDVEDPSDEEIDALGAVFGLHPVTIEDAHHLHQRPKVELFEGYSFVVVHPLELGSGEGDEGLIDQELHAFVSRRYLATLRYGPDPFPLDVVMRRWRAQPELLASEGGGFAVYVLIDEVVDGYLSIIEAASRTARTTWRTSSSARAPPRTAGRAAGADLPAQARGRAAPRGSRRRCAKGSTCSRRSRSWRDRLGPVLPRRDRARDPRLGAGGQHPRPAHLAVRGSSVAQVANQLNEIMTQAHGVGGDPARADADRRHLRDELRRHARAAVALRVREPRCGDGAATGGALYVMFKRRGMALARVPRREGPVRRAPTRIALARLKHAVGRRGVGAQRRARPTCAERSIRSTSERPHALVVFGPFEELVALVGRAVPGDADRHGPGCTRGERGRGVHGGRPGALRSSPARAVPFS